MTERRKDLSEEAITKAVKKAMAELNGEKEVIAEKAIEKFIDKINMEPTCPIGIEFKDDAEKEKFQEAIPSLLEFNEGVKKTRKATRWIGLVFATYFLNEFIDFVISIWDTITNFINK